MADIVYVVGLGPGDPQFLTAQAQSALEEAEVLCGYPVYLDLVRPYYPEKEYYATGMSRATSQYLVIVKKQKQQLGLSSSLYRSMLWIIF